MKKILLVLTLLLVLMIALEKGEAVEPVIPNDAIRLRVIANSNSAEDQAVKSKVKDEVQKSMYKLLGDVRNIDLARVIIRDNLQSIENSVQYALEKENDQKGFTVTFGVHHFPKKEYKGVVYPEGDYEAVVVTLGCGEGDNWWCVLFPPLCVLEAEESDEVEYKLFVYEIVKRFTNSE